MRESPVAPHSAPKISRSNTELIATPEDRNAAGTTSSPIPIADRLCAMDGHTVAFVWSGLAQGAAGSSVHADSHSGDFHRAGDRRESLESPAGRRRFSGQRTRRVFAGRRPYVATR